MHRRQGFTAGVSRSIQSLGPTGTTVDSAEINKALKSALAPGERVLWSGMPRQGVLLRPSDALMIPFSLMWGGFAFFWEFSAISSGAPLFFWLWGIPFVLVGIYIIVGRFFVDSYQRSRTYYGVTDERVVIVSGLVSQELKSLELKGLSDLTLHERADGTGSITFGASPFGSNMWAGAAWPGMRQKLAPSFDLIQRVRYVYDLIRTTQRGVA